MPHFWTYVCLGPNALVMRRWMRALRRQHRNLVERRTAQWTHIGRLVPNLRNGRLVKTLYDIWTFNSHWSDIMSSANLYGVLKGSVFTLMIHFYSFFLDLKKVRNAMQKNAVILQSLTIILPRWVMSLGFQAKHILYWKWIRNFEHFEAKLSSSTNNIKHSAGCLKITEKVWFKIASEAMRKVH